MALWGLWRLAGALAAVWAMADLHRETLPPLERLAAGLIMNLNYAKLGMALGLLAAGLVTVLRGRRLTGKLAWYHAGAPLAVYGLGGALVTAALAGTAAALVVAVRGPMDGATAAGLLREGLLPRLPEIALGFGGLAVFFLGRRAEQRG